MAPIELLDEVRFLDLEPDLADSLLSEERSLLEERLRARTKRLGRGAWPGVRDEDEADLYIVSGLMIRQSVFEDRKAATLFAPGHVMRAAPSEGPDQPAVGQSWRVLEPTWVAVLDAAFWDTAAVAPSVGRTLMRRALAHEEALSARLAIVGTRNLPQRLLALLWTVAWYYGHRVSEGTTVGLDLSQETLADLAAARRTSVNEALGKLTAAGQLSRLPGRGYVLHGAYEPGIEL